MREATTRGTDAHASPREWWKSVPLDLALSAAAILLAAALKLAGLMP